MTDQDIIKSLEICYEQGEKCSLCPMHKEATLSSFCWNKLVIDALNLIRRQQKEINRLKKLMPLSLYIEEAFIKIFTDITKQPKPEQRPPTSKEFLEELKKYTYHTMIGGRPYKIITEQGMETIAERMGVNK